MNAKHVDNRIVFERQIKGLQKNLLKMGNLVEEAIARAIESLKERNLMIAEEVIKNDDHIDQLELKIEEECLALIATQQPMAGDLRRVATLFKMIVDLERMADYASDIAKTVKRIGNQPLIKPLVDIPRMTTLTQLMVKEALDSYIKEDVSLAVSMARHDDEIDTLHRQIFRELLTIMMGNPRTITQASHLLFISRYLERIADHATNIGESVVFLVTGEKRDLNE